MCSRSRSRRRPYAIGKYFTCPNEEADHTVYNVVFNREDQYSIWPAVREPPAGWRSAGVSGTKQECLAHQASLDRHAGPKPAQ
ncbi:MbtH family protein [Sorangium sp. So ce1335]|uniref:MbtH family protein n=1 Tax=Sorangium sp. So ce1335 TaxID=3133335 RepID=UPI003F5EBE5D